MRWLFRAFLVLVILFAVYAGTAVASLKGLVEDTRRGDVAAVMSRVDLPRLRNSLAEQIVRVHFRRIEQTRPVKTIERIAAPTVIDALLAQLLTQENIAQILQSGALPVPARRHTHDDRAALVERSRIGKHHANPGPTQPKSPVQLRVRLDDAGEAAIRLHFGGTRWKLSGIDLPAAALEKLVARVVQR